MLSKLYTHRVEGFSLLEVMIAVLVLGVGIMAVASMQTTSMSGSGRAQRETSDTVAAARCLEHILAIPYFDVSIADQDGAFLPQQPDHGPFPIAGTNRTIEWEVDDDFPLAHAKRISVTIRRPGRNGDMKSVRYNYIKSRGYAP